jgi:hypothetical protein
VTWSSLRIRHRIYRSLIQPQDDAQDRNINSLLWVGSIYSVFLIAVALVFLAWGIAPIITTTLSNAFIQGGEVKVVIQYFDGLLHQCVILFPVIYATQIMFRVWQAIFLGQGLQAESILADVRVQEHRRAFLLPLIVTLVVWIIILTIVFAGIIGLIGFLDTITIESI